MLDNFWLRRVKRTNDTSLERKWSGASNKKAFKWFWLLSTEKKLSEHDILRIFWKLITQLRFNWWLWAAEKSKLSKQYVVGKALVWCVECKRFYVILTAEQREKALLTWPVDWSLRAPQNTTSGIWVTSSAEPVLTKVVTKWQQNCLKVVAKWFRRAVKLPRLLDTCQVTNKATPNTWPVWTVRQSGLA